MLLGDRYLVGGGTALDLATGAPARLRRGGPHRRAPHLFDRRRSWRLVDVVTKPPSTWTEVWERWGEDPISPSMNIESVKAALAGARDGCPHAVDVIADGPAAWRRVVLDIAREATAAAFVPVAVDVLGNVLDSARWRWPSWLRDRSLLVLTCDGQLSACGTLALLRLATRDARPHLVVRGATCELRHPTRLVRLSGVVHEVRSRTPRLSADELAEQAWRRCDTEAAVPAEATACARWAVMLAPSLESEAVARSALAHGLVRQGLSFEARAALAPARDVSDQLPDVVRQRIETVQQQLGAAERPRRSDRALVDDFLEVLQVCQDIEDESVALGRVLVKLRERLACTRMAFVVGDERELRVVSSLGNHSGSLSVPGRTIESGTAVVPESSAMPAEGAWPVRYGGATVGALWCVWSSGFPVLPEEAAALLRLAATATAPRLYTVAERLRPSCATPEVPEIVGESRLIQDLCAAILRAGRAPFPVLIEGESGSGKELVARAIHRASPRRDRRLSALNCAALSDELAEAELFGHAKGAFTGAVAERPGLFEEAHGGTLFLDEVSELSGRIQAKLLRVLQEQEVRRLGEAHVRRIDTRIVAATNRPLAREAEEGRFRRDLRYRLDVIRLSVPPLRDRLEDLPLLVRHFWNTLAARTGSRALLSPSAMAALGRHDWPGNVRELQNVLASVMVAAPPRGSVGADRLPAHIARVAALGETRSLAVARRDFEIRFVRAALARVGGRQGLAARNLGVSRQGLAKLVGRLGLGDLNE
jgi:DNA-binding NtrC family response regulator